MWLKWMPWRYLVSKAARARGFLDPIPLLAHLHRFAQPSEIAEPLELLRAGVVFHARGLMNSRVIQHNLDWVWPYWVERQFDPQDESFVPRAFSITHVNLTHRNWTAVGVPDHDALPIVDPRGLLTPLWDSWSLDAWLATETGAMLLPSRQPTVEQRLETADGLAVVTRSHGEGLTLESHVHVETKEGLAICRQRIVAESARPGWLIVALRPYNPEGVSFVHDVVLSPTRDGWTVNGQERVLFSEPAALHFASTYRTGDVYSALASWLHKQSEAGRHNGSNLTDPPGAATTDSGPNIYFSCDVGMATAAALFELRSGGPREITVSLPLEAAPPRRPGIAHRPSHPDKRASPPLHGPTEWSAALGGACRLRVPDERFQFLFDAVVRSLVLHSPGDVYPGPYTYKRFWFRDAAFILHALLCAGLKDRVERAIDLFPRRQTRKGYFLSQEGEWDSNGAALWIMRRYCALTARAPKPQWHRAILRGARWIARKRLSEELDAPHAGLLPAGFSAEHLGPNDYYYWDDFFGAAGLQAAAEMCDALGDRAVASEFQREAQQLLAAIDRSLAATAAARDHAGIPASPYRRMDAGAIGSLAAGYPLALWDPDDPRLLHTVDFLLRECFVRGGFFQDMIHSGVNPYLTLHVAQVVLRAGAGEHCHELMQAVARLASPTGQWPEAVHPRTLGGCMGDGQHMWAAAEWLMAMRNCFIREEGDRLVVGSGIPPQWLEQSEPLELGPTPTPFGDVTIEIAPLPAAVEVQCRSDWRHPPAAIEFRLPGFEPIVHRDGTTNAVLERAAVQS